MLALQLESKRIFAITTPICPSKADKSGEVIAFLTINNRLLRYSATCNDLLLPFLSTTNLIFHLFFTSSAKAFWLKKNHLLLMCNNKFHSQDFRHQIPHCVFLHFFLHLSKIQKIFLLLQIK